MKYCPLMSYAKQYSQEVPCLEEKCGFADEAGHCLIKQALQCYVAKERTATTQEDTYYRVHKDSTFDPIVFKENTNKTTEVDCFWERKE